MIKFPNFVTILFNSFKNMIFEFEYSETVISVVKVSKLEVASLILMCIR